MPSFEKPTSAQIDAAVQRMRSPEFAAYFLSRLENPLWISALKEHGLFSAAPPPVEVEDGGVRYPHWPASRYLARMAVHAPLKVAPILAEIRTNNSSVLGDILDAAMAMPATESAALVPAICYALERNALFVHFDDASQLCVRLAEGGERRSALTLGEALFSPTTSVSGQRRPGRVRRDQHWYKKGMATALPALVSSNGRVFLEKLCEWLTDEVDARQHVDPESGEDFSYLWRPAIEEHKANRDYEFAGVMTGFARAAFEQAIRGDQLTLPEALQLLSHYSYRVFERLRIHLIAEFADREPELARQAILDRHWFDDYEFKHEYAKLVERRFQLLTPEQQEEWLGWVEAATEPSEGNGDENAEQFQKRLEYRRFRKFHWVRSFLTAERKTFYDRMYREHGEPELADLNVAFDTRFRGNESPISVEELSAHSFEEAVAVVSNWRPSESGLWGPNIEGLASTFSKYVATAPGEFSSHARLLIGRPAVYVRRFINQMSETVKAGRDVDLVAVFDLCQWVVNRPINERTTPTQEDEALVDQDWQWSRNEICGLIENVCQANSAGTPKYSIKEFRERIWQLLGSLTHDATESSILRDIAQEDPRVHDYLQMGINCPQGKAVEATFEYARWIANHVKESDGKQGVIPMGLDSLPEVRDTLERLIRRGNRSFETLSVIGSNVNLIWWIDNGWLAAKADEIFDLDRIETDPHSADGWAAWNAFLVWVSPHFEFYRTFKSQFAYAVAQAAKVSHAGQGHEQPMLRLGEHLMLLYTRGNLGLDEDGGILRTFIESAHPEIRQHAIGFIASSLDVDEDPERKIPDDVIQRLVELWDEYWSAAGKGDAGMFPDAVLFGGWFACGQFPPAWALERLEEFVAVAPLPEPVHLVAEQLARHVTVDPLKVVRILNRMIRGDREGWHVHDWLDSTRLILEAAIAADGEAGDIARQLIDHLGRRGYLEFGNLLG